jgi:Iron-containing redox enzyme
MRRPAARGPRSEALLTLLSGDPSHTAPLRSASPVTDAPAPADPLRDGDLQLSLLLLYELHYRGIDGVDDAWEWHPGTLEIRHHLERLFEAALRSAAAQVIERHTGAEQTIDADGVMGLLLAMTAPTGKPGLSSFLARRATIEQYRELLINRSVYHLKEADPHTFAIPRLSGDPKAALVEIQADEYGTGRPEWVHATLFARTMEALGLNSRYGHYLDQVPAITLASANAMSLFGLHRRLRGAVAGHLAVFEMTSTVPNRLYAQGLRRLGLGHDASAYFDEHVEADAVHEQIALHDLVGSLLRQEPDLATDVLLGAGAAVALDDAASAHLMDSWSSHSLMIGAA